MLQNTFCDVQMLPKVIIHNSVSLDGSLTDFEPNMEVHYRIAGEYRPQITLIGSVTAKVGVQMFGGCPPEEKGDFEEPKRNRSLPVWAIVDTQGAMRGMLHAARRFEYARSVVVIISEKTPPDYVRYLKERNYPFVLVGKDKVDIERTLELLSEKYKAKRILTDTGCVLGNLLLERRLVSEVSLLVHPVVVGKTSYNMFGRINKSLHMKLVNAKMLEAGLVWLVYRPKEN